MTPSQQQTVLVNWTNETHLFLMYFSASSILYENWYAEIVFFFWVNSFHVMWPSGSKPAAYKQALAFILIFEINWIQQIRFYILPLLTRLMWISKKIKLKINTN